MFVIICGTCPGVPGGAECEAGRGVRGFVLSTLQKRTAGQIRVCLEMQCVVIYKSLSMFSKHPVVKKSALS